MKKIIIFCTAILSLLVVGCAKTEVEQPVAKKRTITVSASMPDQKDNSRGYTLGGNNKFRPNVILGWDNTDKLKLCFEQKGKFYHKEASIQLNSITDGGKNAKFTIELPTELTSTEPFNLYAIYQKTDGKTENGGYFQNNSAKYILEYNEERCITLDQQQETHEGTSGMIRPALKSVHQNITADKLQQLSFQHLGWIMAVHILNTTEQEKQLPQNFQLKYPVRISTDSHIYNGSPSFSPVSIDLANNDKIESLAELQNTILFDFNNSPLHRQSLGAKKDITIYRWLVSTKNVEKLEATLEPELKEPLEIYGDAALPGKEKVENGKIYHIRIKWSENKIEWGWVF
ncbi:MAG: hypothetical protein SPJ29_04000 [Phocaeicola sp.]|nr:hypothetical protein [Phocaeicola sp.]MDD7447648.1 hypothetical protein [Prevotellaceae bacterium]MDY3913425.1 hypothetical protein [Phocaeicola sp.]MDY5938900.1 hypothetical protein [Phocaeicola sp.]